MADYATRKHTGRWQYAETPWVVLVVKTVGAWPPTESPQLTCSDTAFIRFHHKPHIHLNPTSTPRPQPLQQAHTHLQGHKQINALPARHTLQSQTSCTESIPDDSSTQGSTCTVPAAANTPTQSLAHQPAPRAIITSGTTGYYYWNSRPEGWFQQKIVGR